MHVYTHVYTHVFMHVYTHVYTHVCTQGQFNGSDEQYFLMLENFVELLSDEACMEALKFRSLRSIPTCEGWDESLSALLGRFFHARVPDVVRKQVDHPNLSPPAVGTDCWHRLLAPTVDTDCWHRLLAPAVGTACWHRLLAPAVGTDCWHRLLAPTVGTDCWRRLMH